MSTLMQRPAAVVVQGAEPTASATSAGVAVVGARPAGTDWPHTRVGREQAWERLMRAPFVLAKPNSQYVRANGLHALLDWLGEQPGDSWQQRWFATGAESARGQWRDDLQAWLRERRPETTWRASAMSGALIMAISIDLIRPSLAWLISNTFRRGQLVAALTAWRDPSGFSRLRQLCDREAAVSAPSASRTIYRAALIVAGKGGDLGEINPGDVLELLDEETAVYGKSIGDGALLYRMLHTMGCFGDQAPATLRQLRTGGQLTPDELIDRYRLRCRPIRDLLVDYLRERQPALDYTSLESLAGFLGNLFWADLERHHTGIDNLHLPVEVATAWKQRLRTTTKTIKSADGTLTRVSTERINYRECLTPVRAFYLDLAHWAVEDPARWAPWVVPCPVGAEEINRRKHKRHRKARMDARTRQRLPVLPVLARSVREHRGAAAHRLTLAGQTAPGEQFSVNGLTFTRACTPGARPGKVWIEDPVTGKRRDLGREEHHAFWAWATVEVLRATGIRVEELLELSHHSLVQYRLPTTGELVPLLQIVPSKTDQERLLVVSPELAEVLSAIITRVRDSNGTVPLVPAYDSRERLWSPPAPLLFQHRHGTENRAISTATIRTVLINALAHTGLTDPVTKDPLIFTPHDFRRLFITDAILNGLPPHIAQIIAGHHDINVTLGYKAVYPDEAIQAHLAFLARRRALRPSEEYRVPTDEEWEEFLGHFERRKVSIGTCGRAFDTPCIHEHACVRCPMLWPDPAQRPRLIEIRDNLTARITEARREGWLGEVEGLHVSLAGAQQKLTQLDRPPTERRLIDLGIPTLSAPDQPAG
jgi:integrase